MPTSILAIRLLILSVVLLYHGNVVSACQCRVQLPQEKFCQHDFVVKAEVKDVVIKYAEDRPMGYSDDGSMGYPNDRLMAFLQPQNTKTAIKYTYKVRIHRVYRNSYRYRRSRKEYVMSPGMDRACGKLLEKNQMYLLTGTVINRELWIDGCGWNVLYKTIPRNIKRKIWNVFKKHCDCKIKRCLGKTCSREMEANQCTMQIDAWTCYENYGVCAKRPNQRNRRGGQPNCFWRRPHYLKKCLKKLGQTIIKPKKKPRTSAKTRRRKTKNNNANKKQSNNQQTNLNFPYPPYNLA